MTTANQTPLAAQETLELRVDRRSRVIKAVVAMFAVLYMINGAVAAIGYTKALRIGHESSAQIVAQAVWVGVAWPVVVHDMMRAKSLQRGSMRSPTSTPDGRP